MPTLRAAVDSIGHQICDIVDVIEERSVTPRVFRADGGATSSALVVQTQADLLGRDVEVADVPEVSALGVAKLAWRALGREGAWPTGSSGRIYRPIMDPNERRRRRDHWAGELTAPVSLPGTALMETQTAPQWREVEIAFVGPRTANPYTDVDAWVIFTHDSGRQLRRPVFWDGGSTYRVRFASTQPKASGSGAFTPAEATTTSRPLPARCSPAHPSKIIRIEP